MDNDTIIQRCIIAYTAAIERYKKRADFKSLEKHRLEKGVCNFIDQVIGITVWSKELIAFIYSHCKHGAFWCPTPGTATTKKEVIERLEYRLKILQTWKMTK